MANEKLRTACFNALETFKKLNDDDYAEIQSKLEFVVGSFDFDGNPVGLYEFGTLAIPLLKKAKETYPRKITKKVIEELEKAVKN